MGELIVRAHGLGKRYRIGGGRAAGSLGAADRQSAATPTAGDEGRGEMWALRDVTFDVRRGEVLGIAGANGCGKSTALRLMAGITEPTEGWIAVRGHLAPLLEAGTGFHPELTGRENVLMTGIVLGMRAAVVRRRFDEIVEFAGVARFVDTPVKHYSSGMCLRLAFAVAAHLDADLLLLDEVLAMADLEFQARCQAKIHGLREEGRSVLLVTHSVAALRQTCTRALLLSGGRLVLDSTPDEVARRYEVASR